MTDQNRIAEYEIVLVGCGKMGSALGEGLVESGVVDPGSLVCADRDAEKARRLADATGAETIEAGRALEETAGRGDRIVVVAVKPKDVADVLERNSGSFADDDTIVSIAAGVPTDRIRDWAGEKPKLVRAMPNTPALVGRGITGVYAPGEADMEALRELFAGVGRVVELEKERDFDALTGVSGSGPAYVFTAIEALADGAVSMGLSRETSIELAVETLLGAATLARERDAHTAELKDEVTSPGGTTITGVAELERQGFRSALLEAVRSAATRSEEMTDELRDDE